MPVELLLNAFGTTQGVVSKQMSSPDSCREGGDDLVSESTTSDLRVH